MYLQVFRLFDLLDHVLVTDSLPLVVCVVYSIDPVLHGLARSDALCKLIEYDAEAHAVEEDDFSEPFDAFLERDLRR